MLICRRCPIEEAPSVKLRLLCESLLFAGVGIHRWYSEASPWWLFSGDAYHLLNLTVALDESGRMYHPFFVRQIKEKKKKRK